MMALAKCPGKTEVAVSAEVVEQMMAQAALAHPLEACGLLLGTADRIDRSVPAANIHPTPRTHFEIDPAALVAAHKAARGGGPQIVGYWHSHPAGTPAPSATDQASASGDGSVWAIVAADQVTFWRDLPGGFEPLSTQAVAV
jgi:proteasome lid subunit RPN8/RPN11